MILRRITPDWLRAGHRHPLPLAPGQLRGFTFEQGHEVQFFRGLAHPTGYPLYVLIGHPFVLALHALGEVEYFLGRRQQFASGLVERQREGFRGVHPAEFPSLVVQNHLGRPPGMADEIQQHKVGVAIKFPGMNAVLHQDKLDIGNRQVRLLEQLAAQGILGTLSPLNFAPGNPPEI